MPDPGMFRAPALQAWQRTKILGAANCLREQISRTPEDARLLAAYDGLLDLLEPSRMVARRQREMSDAARRAAASIKHERRRTDRRRADRRQVDLSPPGGVERRGGGDRRGRGERRGR